MTLPQLPGDKANHAVYGFSIFIITVVLIRILQWFDFYITSFEVDYGPLIMVGLAAVLREVYGKLKHNRWEILDIVATIAPAIILTLILIK